MPVLGISQFPSRPTAPGAPAPRPPILDPSARTVCGNPACSGGWLAFLRDRRRPVFERQWACSIKCLEAMLQSATQHESGADATAEPGPDHRHRVPLGLILLAHGWITQQQLQHTLDRQRRAGGGRIGQWLVEEYGLDPACVTRGLSVQWGCPALTLDGFEPEAMALTVPRLLVEQFGMLPICMAGRRTLYLASHDQLEASMALAMERMTGLKIQSGLIDETRWTAARQRLLNCNFVDASFEQVANRDALPRKMAAVIAKLQPQASRLVRVHQFYWLRLWLESGAMTTRDGGLPRTREDVVDRLYFVGAEQ